MIKIGMSTSCTFPKPVAQSFALAKAAGYDGIEVMVSTENDSRNAEALRTLAARFECPVLSVHAPVLFFTQFVWGTNPAEKLARTVELAHEVGAETVVVHPPFRWQGSYATRFEQLVRELEAQSGLIVAVENMFPWNVAGSQKAYLPGTDPTEMDVPSITLDFSHAALSGDDSLAMAKRAGDRLRHIHLCDGEAPGGKQKLWDEHLLPGQGGQPVAETLRYLADRNWHGQIIAEVNTRKARGDEAKRLRMLRAAREFAQLHTRLR